MLNQLALCGRVANDLEIVKEDGKAFTKLIVAVPRSYKNADGIYETDFIPCILWSGIAEKTTNYCKKGDVIVIKGHLQNNNDKVEVIAEKITFLSTGKKESEEN